jgi:hypothetical protein
MDTKNLIGNQMHFPSSCGRVLVRAFKPEHFAYIGTDKIEIPIPIDIMKDAVDTTGLHFRIFGLGFGKDEGLVIISGQNT